LIYLKKVDMQYDKKLNRKIRRSPQAIFSSPKGQVATWKAHPHYIKIGTSLYFEKGL